MIKQGSTFTLGLAACLALVSCSDNGNETSLSNVADPDVGFSPNKSSSSDVQTSTIQNQTELPSIKIRTMSGQSQQTAYLLPQPPELDPAAMAKGLVESGFSCSSVREFHQLQQDDKPMDVFKIDCAEGSYQATIINGATRLKPWTGVMLGE